MKIRSGFVSNSSSSSFVLSKKELSKDQLLKIEEWVGDHNDHSSDGQLYETKNFIFGQLDNDFLYNDEMSLPNLLNILNISLDNWEKE